MRKIRNKKFCLIMAIIFAFSMVFPMAAMATISRSGSIAVVDDGGNMQLNAVKVTASEVKQGHQLILALPKDFNFNVTNWTYNVSTNGDVYYGDISDTSHTYIVVPQDNDNGFNGAPGVTGSPNMLNIEYLGGRHEIRITVIGTPSTSKNGNFTLYLNNVWVDDGYDGDINLKATSPPGSAFDSGDVVVGRVTGGDVTVEVTDTDNFDDTGSVTMRLTEDRVGAFDKDKESVKFTLPKGFIWKSGPTARVIYGDDTTTGSMVADPLNPLKPLITDIFELRVDGDDLILEVKRTTNKATCLEITADIVVDDERKATLGDITAKVRGKSDVSPADVIVGFYGEVGIKATAGDPKNVYGGQLEQEIANITLEEVLANSFVGSRTVTLTLPTWAKWGDLPSSISNGGVQLYLDQFPGKDGQVAKYKVSGQSSGKGAKLEFKNMEIALSPLAPEGDVVVEIGGTQGFNAELVVAKNAPALKMTVSDTPVLVIGRPLQDIGEITLTEAAENLIRDGKRDIILELPQGVYWDGDPDVQVTGGDLEIRDIEIGHEDIYNSMNRSLLYIEIDDSSNDPAEIKIKGTVTADRTVPEGPVEVKVKGNAPIEVNDVKDVDDVYGRDADNKYWLVAGLPAIEIDSKGLFYNDKYVTKGDVATIGTPAPTDVELTTSITLGDNGSYISDGRIMVQLRDAANALGVLPQNIFWDTTTKTATLVKGDRVAQIKVGVANVTLNGVALPTDKGAEIRDGRTYVSLSAAGVALGAVTTWDNTAKVATLTIK